MQWNQNFLDSYYFKNSYINKIKENLPCNKNDNCIITKDIVIPKTVEKK